MTRPALRLVADTGREVPGMGSGARRLEVTRGRCCANCAFCVVEWMSFVCRNADSPLAGGLVWPFVDLCSLHVRVARGAPDEGEPT